MKVYAQKQNQPRQKASPNITRSSTESLAASPLVNSILYLQRTIGNQAVQRLLHASTEGLETGADASATTRFAHDFSRIPLHSKATVRLQAKLTVNAPGDVYEQEADRIADQMMAMSTDTAVRGAPPRIHRFSGQSNGQTAAVPASVGQVLASPGRPLEPALQQDMEQRFGHDFSRVRMHSGSLAEQSAQDVNAHAYTVGHNIVFGVGKLAPGTNEGRRLIAHELTHVLQQARHPSAHPGLQMQPTGAKPTSATNKHGKITHSLEQKVVDKYFWPTALGSIGLVQALPVGQEIWNELERAGAIVEIEFVAEPKDIPIKSPDTQGYTDDLNYGNFVIYVLVSREDSYSERTPTGFIIRTRTVARPMKEVAETVFHELLHAWFQMTFPTGTGHTNKARDPDLAPNEYDPAFRSKLMRFRGEMKKLEGKAKSTPP